MKRFCSLLLTLALLLGCVPAHAEGAQVACAMPSEISAFFAQSSFKGASIGPEAFHTLENTVGGSYAFAVVSRGSANTLYGFEKKNGAWVYWLKTSSCLPQQEGNFQLSSVTLPGAAADPGNTLTILFSYAYASQYSAFDVSFKVNKYGQWNATRLDSMLDGDLTAADVSADHITYYDQSGIVIGTAYGVVQTNLRYFSLSAFPATLSEARKKLSSAPDIPSGSQLTAEQVKFTGGQKFPVYSGPDENYERLASGKAVVSTNDWIQVFGQENGYILIQYALSASQMRFGYITKDALPAKVSAAPLIFDYAPAVITQTAFLTDDPLNSQSRVRTVNPGQSGVTWLAVMGNWVYVEITGSSQPIRGFIPAGAIAKSAASAYTAAFTGADYTAQATVNIESGSSLTATVTVNGPASWYRTDQDVIQGYQVYANQIPVSASITAQQGTDASAWQRTFTLTATLPVGASILGLCPTFAFSGPHADETLILTLAH